MNVSATLLTGGLDLSSYGIHTVAEVIYNPSYEQLYIEETKPGLEGFERALPNNSGAVAVDTGHFTGRSPKDKFIVKDDLTRDTLWWSEQGSNDNKPISQEVWDDLKKLTAKQLSGKRLFVVDAFCGANEGTRIAVRFVTEVAWQAHFVTNMFIVPTLEELATFEPDFVVMNAAKTTNPDWEAQGLNSENFCVFNFTEKMQLIGGTWYGGPVKQHYLLILIDSLLVTMSTAGMTMVYLTLKVVATQKQFV